MDYRNTNRGYGRPLWQWVVIYAVIGLILYGLIYYLFFAGRGYTSGPAETNAPQVENLPGVKQ